MQFPKRGLANRVKGFTRGTKNEKKRKNETKNQKSLEIGTKNDKNIKRTVALTSRLGASNFYINKNSIPILFSNKPIVSIKLAKLYRCPSVGRFKGFQIACNLCHSARLAQRNLPGKHEKMIKGLNDEKVLRRRVEMF